MHKRAHRAALSVCRPVRPQQVAVAACTQIAERDVFGTNTGRDEDLSVALEQVKHKFIILFRKNKPAVVEVAERVELLSA